MKISQRSFTASPARTIPAAYRSTSDQKSWLRPYVAYQTRTLGGRQRCARDERPARLLAGPDLRAFAAGAEVVTDATATASPPPPAELFT